IPLREVPEAIVKNLSSSCLAAALAEPVRALDVKSENIDAVYAIRCQIEGKAHTSLVYVMTPKGKFYYLSFDRGPGRAGIYRPEPSLSGDNGQVWISFASPTPRCRKGESASYYVKDLTGYVHYDVKAVSVRQSCEN